MAGLSLICNQGCPKCCSEDTAEIEAHTDAQIRNRALTLSGVTTLTVLVAHIWFTYLGKSLPIPDIIWAVVLGPWLGAGGSKLVGLLDRYMGGKR